MNMMNIADLKDPNDPERRTYREVNNAKEHALPLKQLVEIVPWDDESKELYGGVRLFVVKHTRDCDGTPLYTLGAKSDFTGEGPYQIGCIYGFSDDCLKAI